LELLLPAQFAGLAGFGALHVDIHVVSLTWVHLGITAALNHRAIQLFVAGLKPAIQDEMMKGMGVILWYAFQEVITFEKIHVPLKVNLLMTN
jgi:hypothetical protein